MNKSNLTTMLSTLCAILLIVLLVLQTKQKNQIETLRQAHEAFVQTTEQQQKTLLAALDKANEQQQQTLTNLLTTTAESLAKAYQQQQTQLANATEQQGKYLHDAADSLNNQFALWSTNVDDRLTRNEQEAKEKAALVANMVQQNTAVMHRALGKVIPVELPASLTNELAALESRIADTNSWPQDSTNADAMVAELRGLIRQIPPWAEEDLLPRLNSLRWNLQSLQVLQANANVDGEALATAAETFANQISTQPDGGSTNIATMLANRQVDATQRFAEYRRESAIKDAKEQLGLAVTTDALAVWQRLSEWTNSPTDGQQVLELRKQLRSRLLKDEVAKFADATKASLQKFGALTNVALRQAGYFQTMENVTVQRLKLLEEPDAPVGAVNMMTDLSASVEARIKVETEKQKQDDVQRVRGYQQWVLRSISDFRNAFDKAMARTKTGTVYGTNPAPDNIGAADAMVRYLVPISPGHLDSAVAKIYGQAFEDGWNKLGGKDEKYLQTEVAQKDATTAKKTPQNYQE